MMGDASHQCRDIPSFLIIFCSPPAWWRMAAYAGCDVPQTCIERPAGVRMELPGAANADLLLPQKPVPPPSASYQLYPLQHQHHSRFLQPLPSDKLAWPSNELWPPGSYYPLWKFKFSKLATFSFGETHLCDHFGKFPM